MKRILATLFSLFLVLLLAACGNQAGLQAG